ncbi:MAG TPA: response regulator transcription factor [Acidimicrobiales bacterium]|nr:response regulator transcription factor [Acidimicrobiales bacterium]
MRVVVVDDELASRLLVAIMLPFHGIEVAGEAADAESALEEIARHQPDAVVLDWRLPTGNGLEILSRIRATFPDIRVVLYTTWLDDRLGEEATALGAAAVVAKARGSGVLARAILGSEPTASAQGGSRRS